MNHNITQQLSTLISCSEDESFRLWSDIYDRSTISTLKSSDLATFDDILLNSDDVLKIYMCRFLAHKEAEQAVLYLLELMKSKNTTVQENAIKAFQKNKYANKIRLLVKIISFDIPQTSLNFAMDSLATHAVFEAVLPLMNLLRTPGIGTELIEKILQAFRHIPDKRIWTDLKPFLQDKSESVRFFALTALGALYENGFIRARKYILSHINDHSSRIRQAMVWSLRRRSHRRDWTIFWNIITSDPDPQVRQEAVLSMNNYPSRNTIIRLIRCQSKEKNRVVQLKIQAVLLAMPHNLLLRILRSEIKTTDIEYRTILMKLYVYFESDKQYCYSHLSKIYSSAASDKERLHIIETVGLLKYQESLTWLNSLLNKQALLSYTAMTAIIKVWGNHNPDFPIMSYLKSENLNETTKQVALKHFVKVARDETLTKDIINHLVELLNHSQFNIRYLAAQGLAKSNDQTIFIPFVLNLLKEEDPTAKKLTRSSLIQYVRNHPSEIVPLLNKISGLKQAEETVFELIVDSHLPSHKIIELWPYFFTTFSKEKLQCHIDSICRIPIAAILATQGLILEDLLRAIPELELQDLVLTTVYKLLESRNTKNLHAPIQLFEARIQNNIAISEHVLKILSYSQNHAPVALLTRLLCLEQYNHLHEFSAKLLKSYLQQESAA